ncbi:hypothetical protein [Streptomyces sp. NPDC059003]|uniref:hypothetical protein n=1 Tax=Streptomyces sp. NPDC059003 TaxID=3346691 RepID=UPI003682F3D0
MSAPSAAFTSVRAFTAAEAHLHRQARGITATVAATLNAQFPTAAFLVIARHEVEYQDVLVLHSLRNLDGTLVYTFPADDAELRAARLPVLRDRVLRRAWGELDPQQPAHLRNLVHRIDIADDFLHLHTFDRPLLPDLPRRAAHPNDPHADPLICLPLTAAAARAAAYGS